MVKYALFIALTTISFYMTGCAPVVTSHHKHHKSETVQEPTNEPPSFRDAPRELDAQELDMLWTKLAAYTPEHELLDALTGSFTTTTKLVASSEQPSPPSPGRASVLPLFDGRYVRIFITSNSEGRRIELEMTLGYDTIDERYTMYVINGHTTTPTLLSGQYHPASRTFHWEGVQRDPFRQETFPIRAKIIVTSDDAYTYQVLQENPDGSWGVLEIIEFNREKKE
jgi:hypothetical protein